MPGGRQIKRDCAPDCAPHVISALLPFREVIERGSSGRPGFLVAQVTVAGQRRTLRIGYGPPASRFKPKGALDPFCCERRI